MIKVDFEKIIGIAKICLITLHISSLLRRRQEHFILKLKRFILKRLISFGTLKKVDYGKDK
jgi:hypothetical protein